MTSSSKAKPVVCVIAGTDSSGRAGQHADIRAIEAIGAHPASIVTAVTAQGGKLAPGVVHLVPADHVAAQLQSTTDAASVKIGMLGCAATTRVVATWIRSLKKSPFVVLDPVLVATSGLPLADAETQATLLAELLPLVSLVTPNVPETEALTGQRIATHADIIRAAMALRERGASAVLIKGGHAVQLLPGISSDYYVDAQNAFWISSHHLPVSARGTGCALASAIAAAVAIGDEPLDALTRARAQLARALRTAINETLTHIAWPTSADDFPWITFGSAPRALPSEFPSCGPKPLGFYLIANRTAWLERLLPIGIETVQLRIKDLTGDALVREIETATRLCQAADVRLFVNDHWRLAIRCGAYGVHLGQEDLATEPNGLDELRAAGLRLGLSTHSLFEAAVARAVRASYIALGPIFPTTCKSMRFKPQGFTRIAEWRSILPATTPLVAIGGLKVEHAAAALAAGAQSIAVVSDVLQAESPEQRTAAWIEALRS